MKIVLVSLANNDTLFLEFGKILRGEAGLNAYELWLEQGNTGTIDDFSICAYRLYRRQVR